MKTFDGLCCESVLDTIGKTPLVDITSGLLAGLNDDFFRKDTDAKVFVKLEAMNPGLSKKDRVALQMIQEARESGELKEGQAVCELTSGNTGTGLAIVCAVLGHPFIAVMSKGNSSERADMMRALGAEVVLVDQDEASEPGQVSGRDIALVRMKTEELVIERGAFRADQFYLKGNFNAHYFNTGPEIVNQMAQFGQDSIGAFVDFVGSSGTFAGVSSYLKEQCSDVDKPDCFIIEPKTCTTLSNSMKEKISINEPLGLCTDQPNMTLKISGSRPCAGQHRIQGGGYSMSKEELCYLQDDMIDGFISVSDEEATTVARLLARQCGIFGGFSGGANVAGALKYLKYKENRTGTAGSVVCLICDSGLKYLSTDLWK